MKITIVCVGNLKEKYWTEAIKEYSKRLSKYCLFTICETKEQKAPENASEAENTAIKETEGKGLLKHIKKEAYVIALEIKGKELTSEALAEKIETLAINGKSEIIFIIGGSIGLSEEVLARADFSMSFSRMTFPHQLMRVILAEQIYRSFRIIKNEPYHK